jgi:hypothetical protein
MGFMGNTPWYKKETNAEHRYQQYCALARALELRAIGGRC